MTPADSSTVFMIVLEDGRDQRLKIKDHQTYEHFPSTEHVLVAITRTPHIPQVAEQGELGVCNW